MSYVPGTDDLFKRLLPFIEHDDDWASRWTLVVHEVDRRSQTMGLEAAVASVWDDLMAERL